MTEAALGALARAQTSPSAPVSSPAPTPFEAARAALGQHPRDVASYLHAGAESLAWLESVFHAIELLHERGGGEIRIRHLVGLGKYVAADMGNMLDCEHEKIVEALDAAEALQKGGAA